MFPNHAHFRQPINQIELLGIVVLHYKNDVALN
jgi:hypothetical protein